jgi:hypothetical protein
MRPHFPGMDPWLEDPDLWPDVHNSLIVAIRDALNPLVLPRYVVRVESRTTVLTAVDADHLYRPDVAIEAADIAAPRLEAGVAVMERTEVIPIKVELPIDEIEETYLIIKELPEKKLVTAIEVLSPTNKKTEKARTEYLEKRHELINSGVSLVEIDLLRSGQPMPLKRSPPPSDYRILVCRQRERLTADLYSFSYKVPLPAIRIPLLPDDPEPLLDLNAILHALLDRARYDISIDYSQPPRPRLRRADEAWAATFLAQADATNGAPETPAGEETTP